MPHMRPMNVSRTASFTRRPENNSRAIYEGSLFRVVLSARACVNKRKARCSVAAAGSVGECRAREVDFRVFDGIRGLLKNGDNARRGAGLLEREDAATSRADRQEERGLPLVTQWHLRCCLQSNHR